METSFDIDNGELRHGKQRVKREKGTLANGARAAAATASTEFKDFVADVEDVVKHVANVSDADVARVRAKIETALSSARESIANGAANIKEQGQRAAKYTDEYVHESPWKAIGIGAAVAAVLGLTIGILAARRD